MFSRFHAACLSVALLSAGCGSSSITAEVDGAFTPGEAKAIQRAADDWNTFVGDRVISLVSKGSKGDWVIVKALNEKGTWGYCQRRYRLIRIAPGGNEDDAYAVALHEFGHALDMDHVDRGVMNGDEREVHFTQQDRKECEDDGPC